VLYQLHVVGSNFLPQAASRPDPGEIESTFAIEHRSALLVDETTCAEKVGRARMVLMKLQLFFGEEEISIDLETDLGVQRAEQVRLGA
jgi:hypothetical protein